MELRDTVDGMLSEDYSERLAAEYQQVRIRHSKLAEMLVKWEADELDFEPDCPKKLLEAQLAVMESYMTILEIRADIERVGLR